MNKLRKYLKDELDTRWRTKGGMHTKKEQKPEVCRDCGGEGHVGYGECGTCEGTGEVWK